MVYCGKPSKGCSSCRERKIRCDQKEPGCGQCEKRQISCPGYRNMVDLMFRDESNHVIKRATTSRPRTTKKLRSGARPHPSTAPQPPPLPPSPLPGSLVLRNSSQSLSQTQNAQKPSSKNPLAESALLPRSHEGVRDFDASSNPTKSSFDDNHHDYEQAPFNYYDYDFDNGEDDTLVRLPYVPSISLQERGTAFFFSRYVATDHGCYQNYDFIYDIWKPPRMNSPDKSSFSQLRRTDALISAGMTAVGLAGLSKITCDRETMMRAQQSYGAALQLANAALRDEKEAVTDSTMLGVLMLGTYEFISGRTPQTLRAWQEHINGAAALASMRGKTQFRTKAGVRMFLMLSHSVLISCIQSGLPMPKSIVDLRNELRKVADSKRPAWRVIDPLYRALQIRHDIKHRRITGVDEIVESLVEVETEFETLIEGLPQSWRYQNVTLSRSNPAVMGPTCHVYLGLTQATAWNAVRTMRMLVQETILEQLCHSVDDPTSLPLHHQVYLVRAMRLLRMLGEAVVGSVPQHFGIVSSRDVKRNNGKEVQPIVNAQNQSSTLLSTTPLLSPVAAGRDDNPSSLSTRAHNNVAPQPTLLDPTQSELDNGRGCDTERFLTLATASNTIIWPLYTLGLSSSCTLETRTYIVDRLMAIYRETGLEQARVVAGMMQNKVESLTWASIPTARLPSLPDDALPSAV